VRLSAILQSLHGGPARGAGEVRDMIFAFLAQAVELATADSHPLLKTLCLYAIVQSESHHQEQVDIMFDLLDKTCSVSSVGACWRWSLPGATFV
jgi:hypothetical protein